MGLFSPPLGAHNEDHSPRRVTACSVRYPELDSKETRTGIGMDRVLLGGRGPVSKCPEVIRWIIEGAVPE